MKSIKLKFGRWRESCWRFCNWWISAPHKSRLTSKHYLTPLFYTTHHFIQASQFNCPRIRILKPAKMFFDPDRFCNHLFGRPFFTSSIFSKNHSFKTRRQYVF